MNNKIDLKSIKELLGLHFFIPSYQRGYRWTPQQVKDLLDDIQEFIMQSQTGFYCIQPLVVKRGIPYTKINEFKAGLETIKNSIESQTLVEQTEKLIFENTQWEVIDGQQRLTTIYILLNYLNAEESDKNYIPYTIEYETRHDSKEFLLDVDTDKGDDNIDYYHIVTAKKEIEEWFQNPNINQKEFLKTLLYNVKFIWYESVDENPIKVFTRLNIGKISLTNAELIKALFLNKSNFQGSNQRVRLQQNEIAIEWDQIEYSLQNDEFWLFLHEPGYNKPTRIDFIFDLICEKNVLDIKPDEKLGTDEYRTFRYFYLWFKYQKGENRKIDISKCWKAIKKIFQTFQEWFNDLELYHYIGFIIEKQKTKKGTNISEILDKWQMTKQDFISEYLHTKIKEKIGNITKNDLNKIDSKEDNRVRPILLLHNIQTIVDQNRNLIDNEKYKLPVFYKFPFHLFKKEKWDVEHIDSNTENTLGDEKEQKEWLKSSVVAGVEEELKLKIKRFLSQKKGDWQITFEELQAQIMPSGNNEKLDQNEKNKLWNFTLLDSSTNRSYGNAIFAAKRRVIIGKDQGKTLMINDDLDIIENEGAISFIPPSTKNVFLKYYNVSTNNLREWSKSDADAYLKNIKSTLVEFLE